MQNLNHYKIQIFFQFFEKMFPELASRTKIVHAVSFTRVGPKSFWVQSLFSVTHSQARKSSLKLSEHFLKFLSMVIIILALSRIVEVQTDSVTDLGWTLLGA